MERCRGVYGNCGREVYVKEFCLGHYRRWRRGADIHTPIRALTKDLVQSPNPKIPQRILDAIQAEADRLNVSIYEVGRRIYEEWYDGRTRPRRATTETA